MSKTLAQLIPIIQSNLLDDGTRFNTATCTAAVRQALKEFNQRAPINAADLIDAETNVKEYEISDIDSRAIGVVDILLYDSINAEDHEPLPYDDYWEDARLFFRLRTAQPTGKTILARYNIPYTVSGLDSEVSSTLPVFYDDILIDGGCYWACQIRSLGRIEPINLNKGVSIDLQKAMPVFRAAFDKGLALMASKKPPVSEPDTSAWNDSYHNWDR